MFTGISYQEALRRYQPKKVRALPESTLSDEDLLVKFHPDNYQDTAVELKVGANKGQFCQQELASLLQADSYIDESAISSATIIETDVLVIGGGGAGCAAALTAARKGAKVTIATKLRLGDSNTIMAEGGIQVSVGDTDTLQAHFDDTLKAGHYKSDRDLVASMVTDGPDVIRWLIDEGMAFDTDKFGNLITRRAGGTSVERVIYFKDYTGLEMMRVLRESVSNNNNISVKNNYPAIELLSSENGHCAGAILYSLTEQRYVIFRAQSVIIATGGIGRVHLNRFPTTNHFGSTGDGLVLAYRLGAKLRDLASFQYHPTAMAYPAQMVGSLITEGVRSAGVHLINAQGERFIDELKPRDCVSAAILRECHEGRGIYIKPRRDLSIAECSGVWLDTPGLELRHPGLLKKKFPKLFRSTGRAKINPATTPLLVFPALHYQNGGVVIESSGASTIPGLYCAGEVAGGIHGHNRIMGNALLDIISFGRRAGEAVVEHIHSRGHKKYSIDHLNAFRRELLKAGLSTGNKSPMLFPAYSNFRLNVE